MYSLYTSKSILQKGYRWYKKKGKTLPSTQQIFFKETLEKLDEAILRQDRAEAAALAKEVEVFSDEHCKKSFFEYCSELAIALIFALIIATLVRQVWFEPYEIPTGSMRPTFFEQDHVTVTKTAFGINCPLKTEHLYFDPGLVQRNSIFIFSGDKIPYIDSDTTYFWIIPYKKRYIKRCMGKPGDSLYFYGGKIYGIDKEGHFLEELVNNSMLDNIEHIPFMQFEGKISSGKNYNEIFFRQMNIPIGKLTVSPMGETEGKIFNGKEWVKDKPEAAIKPHQTLQTYSDFWGMRNFAMARLLTKKEVQQYTDISLEGLKEGVLYLELRHHPSLTYPRPLFPREKGGYTVMLNPYTTLIPLNQNHLDVLMSHMYTARFVVKNERGSRYNHEHEPTSDSGLKFMGVPDGTYEFYYGKAVNIGWGGIPTDVSKESPLYSHDPQNIQKLYNLGIEMEVLFQPRKEPQLYYPHRYAYFRDGDLYLLGAPVLKKDDPTLLDFNEREEKKQKQALTTRPYIAFKDYGPPLKEGKIDVDFIKTFGITIPDRHYLALGDNHAMSSDSRYFGFVPQANLQGAPCYIFWPPGRWGAPLQTPYPLINIPRSIIWGIALLILAIWYAYRYYNLKRPLLKK